MGKARIRVVFGIVKNSAVSVLFRTFFFDKFVNINFTVERKIVPYNSQLVPILIVHEASLDNQTTTRNTNVADGSILAVETKEKKYVMRVARAMTPQQISETPVLVNTSTN